MISDCTLSVLCAFMLLVHTCNKYILLYVVLLFSIHLRISGEDHLARSIPTYFFLLHFSFFLINKWRTTRQNVISLLYTVAEKIIEIKINKDQAMIIWITTLKFIEWYSVKR